LSNRPKSMSTAMGSCTSPNSRDGLASST
jgi:hypothetical protein